MQISAIPLQIAKPECGQLLISMKSKILVGAEAFMQQLAGRASEASESLYVQAMTFEGDRAGEQLVDLMIQCPATDKRLLIDSFSKVVVSDHFVFGSEYLRNKSFRQEILNTKTLVDKAVQNGIKVKYTNPVGFLMTKYPLRNHKKMMIVDEKIAYLGGVNFSDHNFSWHDMMIELGDSSLASCLAGDFRSTWLGENQSEVFEFGDSNLWLFNGSKSKGLYDRFFENIFFAKKTIQIISPYVSDPLLTVLKKAAQNGVDVSIVSPANNNKSIFKRLLISEHSKAYFKLYHYPDMFHLKAVLIDGETLVFGSSNYDLVSYYFEQEVVFTTKEINLVSEFKNHVMKPILEASSILGPTSQKKWAPIRVMKALNVFGKVASRTVLKPK